MKKILIVVGARPNFMKVAPLMRALKNNGGFETILVHTGQHYDKKMSEVFFNDLEIPQPDFNLNVGSGTHSIQTARIMEKFEDVCSKSNPDLVMVVGDVNSTMACAIVAKKLHIKVAHIEAGLRSNDRDMPEEINRLVTDSISDYFFVTEESGESNLLKEGHCKSKIFFSGNLMIDSLHFGLGKISGDNAPTEEEYGLITLHRPSNVDNIENLRSILDGLSDIANSIKLLFSIHPRTKNNIVSNNIDLSENIVIMDSLPYLEFLNVMKNAKVIFIELSEDFFSKEYLSSSISNKNKLK